MSNLVNLINEATTREAVNELIKGMKKPELIKLAKELKIFVMNTYNKTKIIQAIIENTAGSKLRSEAIRDINLKY